MAGLLFWLLSRASSSFCRSLPLPALPFAADLALVLFAATACFAATAIFLRFAAVRWPLFDAVANNAYGIYLFHYAFVIWMQYVLLGAALPAVAKGAIVFTATLALSWAASSAVCIVPLGRRLIGGRRRTVPAVVR